MKRNATAIWQGDMKSGRGALTTDSGVLANTPYSFATRFGEMKGTNPEELIAAAHAGCFAMALTEQLGKAGLTAGNLQAAATLTIEHLGVSWAITAVHLDVKANIPGATPAAFQAAANEAKANCPVTRAINAKVTMKAVLSNQLDSLIARRQWDRSSPTIGILYPGEMGSSLGKLLSENGFQVVTTAEGRSPRTHRLCRDAGLSVVDSVRDVVERSDIVISLVPPGAALQVARNVAALVEGSSRRLTYIDANSISPGTAVQIFEILRLGPVDFVDGCILGLASRLRDRGTLYLSGPRAGELSGLLGRFMRVNVAGDAPGQASAFKMIISGIPKGLTGLFVETMLLAREMRLLSEALETCNEIYPGVMEVINRMLPTYPQHAVRRGEELREVEQTMLLNGLTPCVLRAVREVTTNLSRVGWTRGLKPQQWTIAEIIEEIHRDRTLRAEGRGPGSVA